MIEIDISHDGSVSHAELGTGTDLPDLSVSQCVMGFVRNLQFPAPDNGSVHVSYPVIFTLKK